MKIYYSYAEKPVISKRPSGPYDTELENYLWKRSGCSRCGIYNSYAPFSLPVGWIKIKRWVKAGGPLKVLAVVLLLYGLIAFGTGTSNREVPDGIETSQQY